MDPLAAKKLNPVERVAKELAPTSKLDEEALLDSFLEIMGALEEEASELIAEDEDSEAALLAAQRFLAFTELMSHFGNALLSYDEDQVTPPPDKMN